MKFSPLTPLSFIAATYGAQLAAPAAGYTSSYTVWYPSDDAASWVSGLWDVEVLQVIRSRSNPVPARFSVMMKVYLNPRNNETSGAGSIGPGPTLMILKRHQRYKDVRDNADYEIVQSSICLG